MTTFCKRENLFFKKEITIKVDLFYALDMVAAEYSKGLF